MNMSTSFTFFKIWFGVIFALIISIVVANAYMVVQGGSNNVSFGVNGMTESRCIDGYKFIVGQDGGARQIMDELGRGAKCVSENKFK